MSDLMALFGLVASAPEAAVSGFWLHPSLLLLVGAVVLPLLPARLRPAWMVLVPVLTFARIVALAKGSFGAVSVSPVHPRVWPGGRAQPRLRVHHGADVHPRHFVRAARQASGGDLGCVDLRGRLDRGDLCRGPAHAVPLLGGDGAVVGLSHLVPRTGGVAVRRLPLPARAHGGWRGVAGRHHAALPGDRQHGLRRVRCDAPVGRSLPGPRRFSPQRGRASLSRLAARCVRRGHLQRLGLPLCLYHEDRGLRAHPRLCRPGDPRAPRRDHGPLRRGVCGARERLPPPARLPHCQPGWLHGGRSRTRHPARDQWRLRPCLRAHPVQGTALHGLRLRPVHDRQEQVHRAGRAVSEDAVDLSLHARRRTLDLGLSPLQRFCQQVDDRPGRLRGPQAVGRSCSCSHRPERSCTRA
jgi:hypothetical protein